MALLVGSEGEALGNVGADQEDSVAAVAAAQEVVDRAWVLDAELSGHGGGPREGL